MARQVCKTVYTFDELTDSAKERARDWYRESFGSDTDWADHTIEDAVRLAALMGINVQTHPVKLMGGGTRQEPTVYWELHVQGAGACFEGTYAYRKGSVQAIEQEAPQDRELHAIARDLQAAQRQRGYRLEARIRHHGRGAHSHSVEIEVDTTHGDGLAYDDPTRDQLAQALRDFMDWIYRQLEAEWDYQTGNEAVDETIRANEYEFDEDGRRA